MIANPLKRLLQCLQRDHKPSPAASAARSESSKLSPSQRDSLVAARKDPWYLAG
ncbi:MAG: hypothetical protein HWE39_11815 [Oceanospirillaceae bacterium]|nr:hypothetical protein [Oceanospirillaceae bacterium]